MYIPVKELIISNYINIIKYILVSQFFYIYFDIHANEYNKSSPEPASEFQIISKAISKNFMIVTADFRASKAAEKILKLGGNALDAAIAAQNVLSVVEPQSSGIGGGGFLLYYDNNKKKIIAYDGREIAPSSIDETIFLNNKGKKINFLKALSSPIAVGVPGLYNMLADAHSENGLVSWEKLFEDAIVYSNGFKVGKRLNKLLNWAPHIKKNNFVLNVYFNGNTPKKTGSIIKNLELKKSLEILSIEPYSLKNGIIAKSISQKLKGYISQNDLNSWKTIKRTPAVKPAINALKRVFNISTESFSPRALEVSPVVPILKNPNSQ